MLLAAVLLLVMACGSDKEVCVICLTTTYTCKDGVREYMEAKVLNNTDEPQDATLTFQGTPGARVVTKVTIQPHTEGVASKTRFEGVTYTLIVEYAGEQVATAKLGPNDACKPGDLPE